MTDVVTRETWPEAARAVGLRLEVLAVLTGKSYSTVYRYANGSRRPSDTWVQMAAAVIRERRAAA